MNNTLDEIIKGKITKDELITCPKCGNIPFITLIKVDEVSIECDCCYRKIIKLKDFLPKEEKKLEKYPFCDSCKVFRPFPERAYRHCSICKKLLCNLCKFYDCECSENNNNHYEYHTKPSIKISNPCFTHNYSLYDIFIKSSTSK